MSTEASTIEVPATAAAPTPEDITGVTTPPIVAPAAPPDATKKSKKKKGEAAATEPTVPAPPPPPVLASGRALEVFKEAGTMSVPQLSTSMSLEERRTAIRSIAQSTVAVDDKLNLVLGELLYEVSENSYHKVWTNSETGKPFETFDEYVQTELGIQKSKAHYLKKIYKVFVVDLDLPVDVLKGLEWSKAILLTDIITKENAAELLGKAKALSVSGVKAMVAGLKGKPAPGTSTAGGASPASPADEGKVRMIFQLAPEQAENVRVALKAAETMSASDNPANNLDLICSDFNGGLSSTGLAGVAANIDRIIKSVERSYGIRLEVKEMDKERYEKLKAAEAVAPAPATK